MAASGTLTLQALLERVNEDSAGVVRMRVVGDTSSTVNDITNDSRSVAAGTLFCCVRGEHHDGHDFAADSVARGAVVLLVDHELTNVHVPQIVAQDTRAAMGELASAFFAHPSRALTVVGVTGTNGKTTTSHMLGAMLRQSGRRTTVLGTLSGARTTPEAPELQRTLAKERDDGTAAVVMEVSSHALALQRVAGMQFAAGVFTNLGHDHLDFHGTHDAYFAAKASLFTRAYTHRAIVNRDDAYGRKISESTDVAVTAFGRSDASQIHVDAAASSFVWRGAEIRCPLGGDFNVMNALAAATTAAELGVSIAHIVDGLGKMPQIPGRFENVNAGGAFAVLVDYAHTPEALRNVVASVREVAKRVIIVFGCGGDRDPSKRADMGAAACGADTIIVTSDNPRHEDPQSIIAAIVRGIPADERRKLRTEVDRRRAIELACNDAASGDVVIIAGRGHETVQSVAGREIPFSDAEVARALLRGSR